MLAQLPRARAVMARLAVCTFALVATLSATGTAHAAPPVCANPDPALTTPAGTPLSGIVVCDGEPTSYDLTGATQPGAGTVTAQPDSSLTFEPDPAFVGDFQFQVAASNADGTSGEPVSVTIAVTNAAPVCVAMSRSVRPLRSTTFALRCSDSDGHPLSIELDTTNSYGAVRLNADDTVTYTATAIERTDTFTVTARDDWASSAAVTVSMNVARLATTTRLRQGARTCGTTVRLACRYLMDILTVRVPVRGNVAPAVAELRGREVTVTIYRRTPTGRWKPLASTQVKLSSTYRYRATAVVGVRGTWRVTVRTPATTGTRASMAHTYFKVRPVIRRT